VARQRLGRDRYADGHLYFRYQDGTMALIEVPVPAEARGSRSPATTARRTPSSLAASSTRDQDELLCYDIKKH
jgi:hypothetical protein